MSYIGIGIIGAGRMGKYHTDIFNAIDGFKVVAVADNDATRADAFSKEYGIHSYSNYQDLLGQTDIQAVSICLPHTLHRDCAVAAANAGKHILCEKPVEVSLENIMDIYRAAHKNKVIVMPGHTHRFYPENVMAKKIIDSGKIGDVVYIVDKINMLGLQAGYPQWMGKKVLSGGGILMNNGVHSIDRVQYWSGSLVDTITARCGTYHFDIDVEDNGLMFMTLENKATAFSEISWSTPQPAGQAVARILGTKGALEIPAFMPVVKCALVGEKEWQEIKAEGEYGLTAELKEFAAAIKEEREPSVTPEMGFSAVAGVLAAYESNKTGLPVKLARYPGIE